MAASVIRAWLQKDFVAFCPWEEGVIGLPGTKFFQI